MSAIPSAAEMYLQMEDDQKALLDDKTREMFERAVEGERLRREETARLVSEREFVKALVYFDSQDRADALVTWSETEDLSDDEVREIISEWWTSIEAWGGVARLRDGMMNLLRRVAPVYSYAEGEDATTLVSPEPLTIYRGNLGEIPGAGSWTMDIEVATMFVRQMLGPRGRIIFGVEPPQNAKPGVWQATVAPDEILGYFNDRGEKEIVVEKAALRNVVKVRELVTENPLVIDVGDE